MLHGILKKEMAGKHENNNNNKKRTRKKQSRKGKDGN
jgi:hypothetical protein